jgi:hypothetical protein
MQIYKNSVRTSKRTLHFTITTIKWLMLFKERIRAYPENYTELVHKNAELKDC